jgi:hypothetical protein
LLRASPELKTTLLCLSPLRLIQPSWLLCSPNKPRPLDYLTNRFEPVRGQLFHWFPLPRKILCWRSARTHHRPIFVLPRRLFSQPQCKIDSLEGNGREGRHQRWCWMALVAIVRWFGGHRTCFGGRSTDRWVDCCVLCAKKYGTLYVLSQKNQGWRSSLFSTAHYMM